MSKNNFLPFKRHLKGETSVSPFFLLICILAITACAPPTLIKPEKNLDSFPEFPEANNYYQKALDYEEDENWALAADQLDSALTLLSQGGMRRDALGRRRVIFHQLLLEEYEIVFEQLGSYQPVVAKEEELPWESDSLEVDSVEIENTPVLVRDIDFSQYDLKIEINDRVLEQIYYLAYRVPTFVKKSLARKGRYDSLIDSEIALAKVPKELKYLALVESGYKTTATSTARAAGIWQFIPSTARYFGMDVTWWLDERRSPQKSTKAAFKYLNRLYKEFGDWYLAMAAYNCGEGRVRRQIKKQGTRNYWELQLPKETRYYVPRILAAIVIATNPEKYNIEYESQQSVAVDSVEVEHCIDLENIAHILDIEKQELRLLNPELRQQSTPPRQSFQLMVPEGRGEFFSKYYKQLDKSRLVCQEGHKVRRGENLSIIAKKYRVSVSSIKSANNMRNSRIWPNQILYIPLQSGKKASKSKTKKTSKKKLKSKADSKPKKRYDKKEALSFYRVVPGDNLYNIGRRLGVSVETLQQWNELDPSVPLKIGQKLNLYGETNAPTPSKFKGRKKVYRVQQGDNLYQISRTLGVKLNDLLKWNNLEGRAVIRKGDLINYYKGKTPVSKKKSTKKPSKKSKIKTYKVKDGDSLWGIAQKFGISVESIIKQNDLKNNRIDPGQTLRIPL